MYLTIHNKIRFTILKKLRNNSRFESRFNNHGHIVYKLGHIVYKLNKVNAFQFSFTYFHSLITASFICSKPWSYH